MDAKAQGIFARNRDVEEVTDAGRWAAAMAEATDRMKELKQKMFLQVTAMTEAEAQKILDDGGKLFMTKDGLGGAYLKADGYMGGLVQKPRLTAQSNQRSASGYQSKRRRQVLRCLC